MERTPTPGVVFELAERAVDFVRRTVGIALDYSPETLPVLDHYLNSVPQEQPETVELVATTAGAYFGEVARKALGGAWQGLEGPPASWRVLLSGDVSFIPIDVAALAIVKADVEDRDGAFEVGLGDRAAVEETLERAAHVSVEEFYSLCGRLETLTTVVNIVIARRAAPAAAPDPDADSAGDDN